MKTLEEYNRERREYSVPTFRAGVLCDTCDTEMVYINPNVVLASWPAQMQVACLNEKCEQLNKVKLKVV